jgi:hypothetical protein
VVIDGQSTIIAAPPPVGPCVSDIVFKVSARSSKNPVRERAQCPE